MGLVSAVEAVAAGVWRLPLASATLPPFDHSNAYLVADGGEAVLVDPGAGDAGALGAVGEALEGAGARLKAMLLTHSHPDHVAGVAAVGAAFGRPPVFVHPLEQGRVAGARALQAERLRVGGLTIHALHTPGHSPGHLSFFLPHCAAALVGDLLAGEGTTWVGAPEGNMRAYLASLEDLARLPLRVAGPGHGPLLMEPHVKIAEIRAHRLAREEQVVASLRAGPQTVGALREIVYPSLHEGLRVLAERTLLAHLEKLIGEGRARQQGSSYGLTGEEAA